MSFRTANEEESKIYIYIFYFLSLSLSFGQCRWEWNKSPCVAHDFAFIVNEFAIKSFQWIFKWKEQEKWWNVNGQKFGIFSFVSEAHSVSNGSCLKWCVRVHSYVLLLSFQWKENNGNRSYFFFLICAFINSFTSLRNRDSDFYYYLFSFQFIMNHR